MPRIYRRTIEGWRMVGNLTGSAPEGEQGELWDLLPSAEQDRIGDKFDLAIADEVMHDDLTVLPGERAYDEWKAHRAA